MLASSAKALWWPASRSRPAVVADTPERAADAAELVVVDYEDLPAVTTALDAAADGAPLLHEGAASNVAFRKRLYPCEATRTPRSPRPPTGSASA